MGLGMDLLGEEEDSPNCWVHSHCLQLEEEMRPIELDCYLGSMSGGEETVGGLDEASLYCGSMGHMMLQYSSVVLALHSVI